MREMISRKLICFVILCCVLLSVSYTKSISFLDLSDAALHVQQTLELHQTGSVDPMESNLQVIKQKMDTLRGIQKSVGDLFLSIESRFDQEPVSKEMFAQLRRRCIDKISHLKLMLNSLEQKIAERKQLRTIATVFAEMASSRRNETQTVIEGITDTVTDLNDSIQLELARLVDTVNKDRGPFSWAALMGLVNRLDFKSLRTPSFKLSGF